MKRIFKISMFLILQYAWTLQGQDSLVAYWDFNTLGGDTVYDVSTNSNYGTNYGGKLVKGIKGNAISFDGIEDYVRIPEDGKAPPSVFAGLGEGAISFWFKANHIPGTYGIAPLLYYGSEHVCDFFDAANEGLIIELGHSPIFPGSQELFYTVWKNGCTYPSFCYDSNIPMPTDEWHHIVVVVGKDYNTGYLNGKEMTNRYYNFGNASYSQFFEDAIAHEKMWLGKGHWDGTTQFFDGAIDEMKIFNKPLSASEVQLLYQDRDTIATTAFTAINEQEDDVLVFPNPVSGVLFYEINKKVDLLTEIKITSESGKTVMRILNPALRGNLDIGHLTSGTYYVGFYVFNYHMVKKIVVMNDL